MNVNEIKLALVREAARKSARESGTPLPIYAVSIAKDHALLLAAVPDLLAENARLTEERKRLREGIDEAREHMVADRNATAFLTLGRL